MAFLSLKLSVSKQALTPTISPFTLRSTHLMSDSWYLPSQNEPFTANVSVKYSLASTSSTSSPVQHSSSLETAGLSVYCSLAIETTFSAALAIIETKQ